MLIWGSIWGNSVCLFDSLLQMATQLLQIHQVCSLADYTEDSSSARDKQNHRKVKIQRKILIKKGPVISSRVICRSSGQKAVVVIDAMKSMTCSPNSPFYVGEYAVAERKGRENCKVFYKCPPFQILDSALLHYRISREHYTEMFFS